MKKIRNENEFRQKKKSFSREKKNEIEFDRKID